MAYLEAEDSRHALRVLRLETGAQVQLFAGGQAYAASICQTMAVGSTRCQLELFSIKRSSTFQ